MFFRNVTPRAVFYYNNAKQRLGSIRAISTEEMKYLIIDGYTADGRAGLKAGGASTGGALYDTMLRKCTPAPSSCDIVYPADPGFEFPELDKYHAVAWTGCSLTVTDKTDPRVIPQIQFARHCFEYGIPQFGSCWAAQIAAVAIGGTCARNPLGREMGIARKITLTSAGRAHPMFEGKPTTFDAYTSHEDEIIKLPSNAINLARNSFSEVQALAVRFLNGDFWAVQYHPEYTLHELARLTFCRKEKLVRMDFFPNAEGAETYIKDLQTLHNSNSSSSCTSHIAWRLGIDSDVLSEEIRLVEVRNFIKYVAIPYRNNNTR